MFPKFGIIGLPPTTGFVISGISNLGKLEKSMLGIVGILGILGMLGGVLSKSNTFPLLGLGITGAGAGAGGIDTVVGN